MQAKPDIAEWLRDLDLAQYELVFRDNAIDLEILPELREADFEKLGILLGHRKRMLRAITVLGAQAPASAALDPTPHITGAERRQLTILFCDIVASTMLATRLDPEDLREVLAAYTARVTEVIQRFGGFVARFLGDGILAYFGYPQAQEHDPEQALRAALALIESVSRLKVANEPMQVRVGVATGLVVVGDLVEGGADHDVFGETPNLAARLQELAEPNTIVVASSTRQLVGDLFDFSDLGDKPLKGFPKPVGVWRLLAESPHESRFEALRRSALTPLVGREEELAMLSRRWQQARSGEGQIVLMLGEAGIGKSRILAAFGERLHGEPHVRLRCFCSPHHQHSAFYPVIAQLEHAAGFARGDTPEAKLDKLRALLSISEDPPSDIVALFADLLDLPTGDRFELATLDPQYKRELTLAAMVRQLEGRARQEPVFLIFEDAHWIDATSFELLDMIAARVPRLPVMLCITFRPEFEPPWSGQAHVTTLAVNRLYRRDAAAIVARVVGNKPLPSEILERITERADGIPLFVEELTKALLEGGGLREQDGGYVLDGPLHSSAIPSSLQASLMARLDRLSSVKEVAQIGAAIGRSFSYEFLAAVARRTDAQLREALDRLAGAGIVTLRGVPPNATVTFKHGLMQDAAYSTLLRLPRQQLHARIAGVLAEQFPETAGAQPEIVAHHYTQAGLVEPAIDFWRRAGERALRRSANVEGVRHLTHALDLLVSRPEGHDRDRLELRLRLALGPAMRALKGNAADEVWKVFSRARELVDGSASVKERMIILEGLWSVQNMRGEVVAAHALAEDCLALAADGADPEAPAMANLLLGHNLWGMGRFDEARDYLERTLDFCAPDKEQRPELRFSYNLGVAGVSFLALALWPLGYPEQALAAAKRALALARGTGHVPLIGLVSYCGAFLSGLLGADPDGAEAAAEATLAYCTVHGVSAYTPWARFCRGAAIARRGELKSGIAIMREGLAEADSAKAGFLRPILLAHLAGANAATGEVELGLELLDEALRTAERTDERSFEAELRRLRGELLLAAGQEHAGEAELEIALQVASMQGARLWGLRAATSLARYHWSQGRIAEGRNLLVPVYDRFAEGFDTPDLTAARSLLADLG